ncbi:hypothetical protein OG402_41030 [Streptomyces anulatus]|nr:hypothetical protein [Streptomyces anulatus]MCX4606813.1 hypothetical protein [Streptomyces anulatus]
MATRKSCPTTTHNDMDEAPRRVQGRPAPTTNPHLTATAVA